MHSNIVRKALENMLIKLTQQRPNIDRKNVLKIVPGASPGPSPGPPRGLPGTSLGPPEAILENMQRDMKKQEKQNGSPDPIFQKNVKFTDPGWTPKSSRSGPESENKVESDVFLMPRWGCQFWAGFSIDFPLIFHVFSMRFFSYFSTVSKNGKVLKTT